MNVHKSIKTIRRKIKSAQQKTNCRALKHKESRMRSAEAVFEMPCAEAQKKQGNVSFKITPRWVVLF